MSEKRRALGKGLAAIIPARPNRDKGSSAYFLCPIDDIRPNPHQPRSEIEINTEEFEGLAASVKQSGILAPILVRKMGQGYEIIAGERRWSAAKKAGLHEVPVVATDASDEEMVVKALEENFHREDLNPIEEAIAFRKLMDQFDFSQEKLAKRFGRERSSVANTLRLLKLPQSIISAVSSASITMGHAKALLGLPSAEEQMLLAERIIQEDLSVRAVEQEVRNSITSKKVLTKPKHNRRSRESVDPHVAAVSEDLQRILGTKVKIVPGSRGGKVEIEYYSNGDLTRIINIMTGLSKGEEYGIR